MPVSRTQLEEGLVATVMQAAKWSPRDLDQQRILTVRVTDDQEVRMLNRAFRGMDETTDVLSFGETANGSEEDLVVPDGVPGVLGDLILSLPYIERAAARSGSRVADEFMLCFVHGLLHLLGFDHGTRQGEKCMFQLQDRIVREVGFNPRKTWNPEQDGADA